MIQRNICAARQEGNVLPQSLNCAAISVLPQAYQETENDDNGFRYPQIVITFSSQQTIPFTSNSTPWFSDQTFRVCLNIFFQVYTVHTKQGKHIFPCVFVLLLNQTEATYTRFSWELFGKVNGNDPEDIF